MAYGSLPSRWNRSVSNPARPAEHDSTNGRVADFGPVALDRHNSLDSVQPLQRLPIKRPHGLPSIKALRERFQGFANGGKKSHQGNANTDGSDKNGESPKKLAKRVGTGSIGKISKLPPQARGVTPSASMPVLASQGSDDDVRTRPSLPPHAVRPSLDAYLARASSSSIPSVSQRPPRTSSISILPRRPQTSENLSPTSQPLPVFNRVSSDFARSAAAPPLSALRAPQYRETETLNRASEPANRHSRILPGATLPTTFPVADPNRPATSLAKPGPRLERTKRSSIQSQESVQASSVGSAARRTSLVSTGLPSRDRDRLKDDLAYRRHSLSPVIPSAANSSPEGSPNRTAEEPTEDQRGTALTASLVASARRTSIGLGFLDSRSTQRASEGGLVNNNDKRRASKPFPGGFVEVPFQPTAREGSAPTASRRPLKAISIAPHSATTPSHLVSLPGFPPSQRRRSSAGVNEAPSPGPYCEQNDAQGPRKSRSVDDLRMGPGTEYGARIDSRVSGGIPAVEPGERRLGGYAARLAELKGLRTPTLDGADKRNSRFETAEADEIYAPVEPPRLAARPGRSTEEEEDDESRPVSPTHFTNSPGAEHPFRLSTYLDFLPFSRPSSNGAAPPATTALLSLSATSTSAQRVDPSASTPNDALDQNLTLAQMEREIVKMERELALAGTPRSFFTDEASLDASHSDLPPSSSQSAMESPIVDESVATPQTTRKWSIVEVEKAYERMKRLLGSSSSSRMYTPSDAGGERQFKVGTEHESAGTETGMETTVRPLAIAGNQEVDDMFSPVRYTAVKAELAKAEIERDAVLDALHETRETLADVRKQRDTIEAELKQERLVILEVRKHLGGENELLIDRLENLIASRAAWQSRAQEALDELKRSNLMIAELERDKNSRLHRLDASSSPPGSPTLRIEQGSERSPAVARLPPPSPDRTATRQRRTISTHSTASSAAAFDGLVNLTHGSPLLSQSIQFLSKSSNDTFSHTPIKSLQPNHVPFPSYALPSQRKASTATTESAFATCTSEEGERSFDSTSSLPDHEAGLRKQDRVFLEELTTEVPKETLEIQPWNHL